MSDAKRKMHCLNQQLEQARLNRRDLLCVQRCNVCTVAIISMTIIIHIMT